LKKLVNMLDCFFLACTSYSPYTSVFPLQTRESNNDKVKEATHLNLLLLLLLLLLLDLLLLSLLRISLSFRRFTLFALLLLFGGIGGFLAGFLLRVGGLRANRGREEAEIGEGC
jgi:glucan phosphoethanolaminetransferase (alkaline phosphatase superfamily)